MIPLVSKIKILETPKRCKVQPGQPYGRYTVIGFIKRDRYGQLMWLCECSCGKRKVVRGHDLRNGKIRSCGCIQQKGKWFIAGRLKDKKVFRSNNQCRFAGEHNLSGSGISACLRGKIKKHKGWVFKWV